MTHRPSDDELAELMAPLPDQPLHVAGLIVGDAERPGWWGAGRPSSGPTPSRPRGPWPVHCGSRSTPGPLSTRRGTRAAAPSCRSASGAVVGWAGELHPRLLGPRSAAANRRLRARPRRAPRRRPRTRDRRCLRTYPLAKEDVALVVDESVSAADVEAALRAGAGDLLESLRLFDVYRDPERLGAGRKSLAYALRFRAPDRTLTVEETGAARDAAVAEAARRVGASQRT